MALLAYDLQTEPNNLNVFSLDIGIKPMSTKKQYGHYIVSEEFDENGLWKGYL